MKVNWQDVNSNACFQSSVKTGFETDFSSLSREELIVRLELSEKELQNNARGIFSFIECRFDNRC
jgi:hypothetical protein